MRLQDEQTYLCVYARPSEEHLAKEIAAGLTALQATGRADKKVGPPHLFPRPGADFCLVRARASKRTREASREEAKRKRKNRIARQKRRVEQKKKDPKAPRHHPRTRTHTHTHHQQQQQQQQQQQEDHHHQQQQLQHHIALW